MLLFCVYRPPNTDTDYLTNLCDYIITIASNYPDAVICCTGDLNLPDIIWESESIGGHRYPFAINELVLNMSAQCGFTQMVNFPSCARNIPDLFFTTHPSYIQQCIPLPGISDHDIVATTVESSISYLRQKSHEVYLWRQANLHEMSNALLDFGLNFVNSNTIDTPLEHLWCDLRNKLLELMNAYFPFKTKHSNLHQPWINHKLKQLRRKKQ